MQHASEPCLPDTMCILFLTMQCLCHGLCNRTRPHDVTADSTGIAAPSQTGTYQGVGRMQRCPTSLQHLVHTYRHSQLRESVLLRISKFVALELCRSYVCLILCIVFSFMSSNQKLLVIVNAVQHRNNQNLYANSVPVKPTHSCSHPM